MASHQPLARHRFIVKYKVEVLLTGSPGEVEAPVGRQAVGAISAEADQERAAIDGEWGEARRAGFLTTPNTRIT